MVARANSAKALCQHCQYKGSDTISLCDVADHKACVHSANVKLLLRSYYETDQAFKRLKDRCVEPEGGSGIRHSQSMHVALGSLPSTEKGKSPSEVEKCRLTTQIPSAEGTRETSLLSDSKLFSCCR